MNWGWVSELTGDLALFAVDSYKLVAVIPAYVTPKLRGSPAEGQEDDVVIVYNTGPVGAWKNAWELLPWGLGLGGGESSILPWGSVGSVLWCFRWGMPIFVGGGKVVIGFGTALVVVCTVRTLYYSIGF